MNPVPIHERDHSILVAGALRLESEGKFAELIQWSGGDFRFLDHTGEELAAMPIPDDLDSNVVWEIWHEFQDSREAHYQQAWEAWGFQMRALSNGGETFLPERQKQMWLEFYRNFASDSGADGIKLPEPELLRRLEPREAPAAA